MVPSQPRLDLGKLKDERVAEEFVNKASGDSGGLGALGYAEELWSAFKTTIIDVAGGHLETHHGAKKNLVSQGALDTIDQSYRAKLNGKEELFRELRRKTVRALRLNGFRLYDLNLNWLQLVIGRERGKEYPWGLENPVPFPHWYGRGSSLPP